jgi:hypothetical protein
MSEDGATGGVVSEAGLPALEDSEVPLSELAWSGDAGREDERLRRSLAALSSLVSLVTGSALA